MIDVTKIAKLANLPLKDGEVKKFEKTLASIVGLVSKLKSVNTTDVQPTSQVTDQTNVFRGDIIDLSRVLTQNEALSNAKKTKNGYFVVPKIFDL